MKINKILSLAFALVFGLIAMEAVAQQMPVFSQYFMNNYLFNPAVGGIEHYADIRAGYRNQWSGTSQPPNTYYISAHMPIGLQRANVKGGVPVYGKSGDERSGMKSPSSSYLPSRIHHGIGILAYQDNVSIWKRTAGYFSYSIHIPMGKKLQLALGANAGGVQYSFNSADLNLDVKNDPALGGVNQRLIPEFNSGFWLYSRNFFLGGSANQIQPVNLNFGQTGYKVAAGVPLTFHGTTGFRINCSQALALVPSVMVRYADVVPVSVDFNLRAVAYNRMWGGISYRRDDAIVLCVGSALTPFMNFTYSYDYNLSNIGKVSSGGHEVAVGFQVNNKRKILSPEQLW